MRHRVPPGRDGDDGAGNGGRVADRNHGPHHCSEEHKYNAENRTASKHRRARSGLLVLAFVKNGKREWTLLKIIFTRSLVPGR